MLCLKYAIVKWILIDLLFAFDWRFKSLLTTGFWTKYLGPKLLACFITQTTYPLFELRC